MHFIKITVGAIIFSFGISLAFTLSFPTLIVHWIFPTLCYLASAIGVGMMMQGLYQEGVI